MTGRRCLWVILDRSRRYCPQARCPLRSESDRRPAPPRNGAKGHYRLCADV